jgi:hypothetical protein
MPENAKPVDLEFPEGGIDLTGEFNEQPPSTTPVAVNVRALNPDGLRERGGSRAGLKRYIPGPLFDGADLIQHLNVIVDPQAAALQQNFIVPGDDWVPDPGVPGSYVPPGGWGYPSTPSAPTGGDTDDGSIRFMQAGSAFGVSEALPANTLTLTLPLTVAAGQVVLIGIWTQQTSQLGVAGDPTSGIGNQNTTLTVRDGNGVAYTQVGGYASTNTEAYVIAGSLPTVIYHRLSVWRRVATATGGGTITVVANPADLSGSGDATILYADAIVHRNIDNAAPVIASSSGVANTTNPPTLTGVSTGSFATGAQGAIVAFLAGGFDPDAGNGQSPAVQPALFLRNNGFNSLWAFGRYPSSGSNVNEAFLVNNVGGNPVLLAFGVSLKKA